ncbi:hypothetical protein A0256_19625 [Mucilaginibacter sp. PAMC 26640]|nr:hypothetical protein A0256_19625 [Mucilaginibacter sp. PAMC 26640]
MEQHYGQIVEYTVRKNGYSITDLAADLSVNRRSVYNYFQNKYLKYDIILRIGSAIRHDFSKEFPDLFTSDQFEARVNQYQKAAFPDVKNGDDMYWKDKYIQLLEAYKEALSSNVVMQ